MKQVSVDEILRQADQAFDEYRHVDGRRRALFLLAIADGIEGIAEELVAVVHEESCLPEARIRSEIGRTTGQLRAFAVLVTAGDWAQATIDTSDPGRKPLPKPDVRKVLLPIGSIVVFGAGNFPLAFSTAGGDTASALAAGCPVIVKSHPAHPRTSAKVASVISSAIVETGMPRFVFQHIEDSSIEVGQELVRHPLTKGVAFTGSRQGGMALFHLAAQREEPIPVFAEMGSVNPVVLLPDSMRTNKELPALLANAVLLGVGQFCTNPGLVFVLQGDGLTEFLKNFSDAIGVSAPHKMLTPGIARNYLGRKVKALQQDGVSILSGVKEVEDERAGAAALAKVMATDFIRNSHLHEEVFGPFSIVVICEDLDQLSKAVGVLPGQLTASMFATNDELPAYQEIVNALQKRSGRMIFNGVPTGVEVCKAMHHGGPFPATTDSRFTSVGNDAIYRFVRPFSFQNAPESLLPPELQNTNPLEILRCVDNEWTRLPVTVFN